ncbi:MAG: hypothetical protein IBJ18_13425 [Phycisphaerales bacterium]|nr:hypothetical protein [Phycisphaerales bacterium]
MSRSSLNGRRISVCVASLMGLAGTTLAQDVRLVKNINTVTSATLSDSSPTNFVSSGGKTFFIATNEKGTELWVTDGTAAGTSLIKDISPGSVNGAAGPLQAWNNGVLFAGTDASGTELWFSDGTAAGTRLVRDITAGSASSSPNTFCSMGTYVLFTANNGATNGNELWRTDGTEAGTVMVKDIFPGASASSPGNTRRIGNTAYFSAQGSLESGGTNFELWKTDGTEAGTVLVKDIRVATSATTGSSTPSAFTEYNGLVYFVANDGSTTGRTGVELYRTDGTTAGTQRVVDLNPGTGSGLNSGPLVVLNNKLYFFGAPPSSGFELCSYDDVNGVQVVADINPGPTQSNPTNLTVVGDKLYYSTSFIPAGRTLVGAFLVVSDGTTAGTTILDPVPGGVERITGPLVVHQGKVYFNADRVIDGSGTGPGTLWVSDGTTAGTQEVIDLIPDARGGEPQSLFSLGDQLLFSAYTPSVGRELWTTDGTAAGTSLFKDLNVGDYTGSGIASMGALNGKLIFSANDGVNGKELWTSDGTEAGTTLLSDIAAGPGSSDPADPATTFPDGFVPFNNKLYFNALQQNVTGIELWSTDGTTAGTTLLRDINTVDQTDFAPEPTGMTVLNGKLVFRARQPFISTGGAGENGSELWESDGTTAGTNLLVDIRPGGTDNLSSSSTPQFITFFDRPGTDPDWIFFSATGSTLNQGNELWRSDGTAAGTVLVKDIRTASPFNSNPNNLAVVGGKLFFAASDTLGNEPYVSDGTSAGTFALANINASSATASSDPSTPVDLNGIAIFSASSGSSGSGTGITQPLGRELFRSDGTVAGTSRVLDINPGTANGIAANAPFVKLGGFLYFPASSAASGTELWRTDGTAAGTTLFADLNPGAGSSSPTALRVIDGYLYFAASDGTATGGVEPYRTDGTSAPVRLADINPEGSSNPSLFTPVGSDIYFTASDGPNGAELWVISFNTLQPRGCNPADIACDDGTPLAQSPGCANSTTGPNEGDYNAFFAADGFFFQAGQGAAAIGGTCDIACDDGSALNEVPGCVNNGVNEGDYNCFFNSLFLPCV